MAETTPDPTNIAGEVEIVPLEQLVLDPRNPNKRDEIDSLKDSYAEFGQDKPVVAQTGTHMVIKGNHSVLAMRELGWTQCRAVYVDDDDAKALRRGLADNRTGETRHWDEPILRELLQEAGDAVPGFDAAFLRHLAKGAAGPEPPDPEVAPDAPVSREGDVWILGDHRLVCGDCTDSDVVRSLVGDRKVAMVFTDPPYGMDLDTDFSGMKSAMSSTIRPPGIGGNRYQPVEGDAEPYDPGHIFRDFPKVPEIILWGADYYAERIPGRLEGSWFVWDKMGNRAAYEKMYGSNFELCWSKSRHKRALVRILWKGLFGLSGEDTKRRVHPTQKPTELARWFLERFTGASDVVVDLFAGSGSTLVACEQMGRIACLAEIDPSYVDVDIRRWEDYTGQKACLEGGKKTFRQVARARKVPISEKPT